MNNKEKSIINKSFEKAIGGGLTGATAMGLQVTTLMWLRTTVNYQYRYGGTTLNAFKTLYRQGGIFRFYQGYLAALTLGPLGRFGDTAANIGVIHYLDSHQNTREIPDWGKTLCASFISGLWRVGIMPLDTLKTVLQVEGKNAIPILKDKIRSNGIIPLYYGTGAVFTANFMGSYPWFMTYNYLDRNLPEYDTTLKKFVRNATIGFSSSLVSDSVTNSIRVIKTTKQSYKSNINYIDTFKLIVKNDGYYGLFTRGLTTKIISNGFQSMMFTVLWKYLMELYQKNKSI